MNHLTDKQREQWAIDGYLHLEQALSPEQVDFFSKEFDRMRPEPGWEPCPDGPLGHYSWLDHTPDLDPDPGSRLLPLDLGRGKNRLGASSLAQVVV